MPKLLVCIVAISVLCVFPVAAKAQKTVILVRHAERDQNGADALTDVGQARAKALARVLKDAGVTTIVRSDTIRTKATAEPTARLATIPEKVIKVDKNHVENVVQAIRTSGDEAVVLYVGHSDTIEPLLRKLNYKGPFSLDDPFGNLIILVPKGEQAVVVRLHY